MVAVVPWAKLEAVIDYPKSGPQGGRLPFPLPVMLRIYCLQQWYGLSDPGSFFGGQICRSTHIANSRRNLIGTPSTRIAAHTLPHRSPTLSSTRYLLSGIRKHCNDVKTEIVKKTSR